MSVHIILKYKDKLHLLILHHWINSNSYHRGFRYIKALVYIGIIISIPPTSIAQDVNNHSIFISTNGNDKNTGTIDAPFLTIERAQQEIRSLNTSMSSDIIVYMRGGVYEITKTIEFGLNDSGYNGFSVIYKAYDCEQAIISGGKTVMNWSLHDSSKNIFKSKIINKNFRQVYINDTRAIRARSKGELFLQESSNGYILPKNILDWGEDLINMEVVSLKEWKCHRGSIEKVIENIGVMKQPYWDNVHNQFDAPCSWIENSYQLLDEPNEWYLNLADSYLYFIPSTKTPQVEVKIPTLEKLLYLEHCNNIIFDGLVFAHTTWNKPNYESGFACKQGDVTYINELGEYSNTIPGSIEIEGCSNIEIRNCSLKQLGNTGIKILSRTNKVLIFNNELTDISASAISIGEFAHSVNLKTQVNDVKILNNTIHNVAIEYLGSSGIFVGHSNNTHITHNELRNLPYTAISIGWGWSNNITSGKNNIVSNNRIDSIMLRLRDGGGIYTLSSQPKSFVSNNYITNQLNQYGALYPDQGSSYITWSSNVLINVTKWLHVWQNTARNNIFEHNYYDSPDRTYRCYNCTIENNYFINNSNPPEQVIDIMKESGVTEILSEAGIPLGLKEKTIGIGEKIHLKYNIEDKCNDIKPYYWATSDSTKLHVTPDGELTAKNLGTAKVLLKSPDGVINHATIHITTPKNDDQILLYPNPTNSHFYVLGLTEDYDVSLIDSSGRNIACEINTQINMIDLSHLKNGIYYVNIRTKNRRYLKKILLSK